MRALRCSFITFAILAGGGCTSIPLPWDPPPAPPPSVGVDARGTVTVGGVTREYRVDPERSNLFILVRRNPSTACNLFHPHAIAARAVSYEFELDRDAPANSVFSARVAAAGLDPDRPEYAAEFEETAGHETPEADREDIRANALQQLDAARHPILAFSASALSTLEGEGTAAVLADIRGATSTVTMSARATWDGDTLLLEGTAPLDGTPHGIPNGSFKDCISGDMLLKMRVALVPGTEAGDLPDASVVRHTEQFFPDEQGCGPVGFAEVRETLALNCGTCHGSTLLYGATHRLTEWADLHVDTPLSPGVPLFNDAWDRVLATDRRRMPPDPQVMSSAERELLISWFETGAHQFTCDNAGNPLPLPPKPAPLTCRSGQHWIWDIPDNAPLSHSAMFPGEDCLGCHAEKRRGQDVTLGGTVFRSLHEEDSCFAGDNSTTFRDIKVEILGADGRFQRLSITSTGNFLVADPMPRVVPPYEAAVVNTRTGERRAMLLKPTERSCNACHTERGTLPDGVTGAAPPGRIVAPGRW